MNFDYNKKKPNWIVIVAWIFHHSSTRLKVESSNFSRLKARKAMIIENSKPSIFMDTETWPIRLIPSNQRLKFYLLNFKTSLESKIWVNIFDDRCRPGVMYRDQGPKSSFLSLLGFSPVHPTKTDKNFNLKVRKDENVWFVVLFVKPSH